MNRLIPIRMIDGVQDRYERRLTDLRLSVIDRCNFRCPYCMPAARFPADHAFLPTRARMSMGEMLSMIDAFVALGVRKLRLTGGEPLLYRELPGLIRAVRQAHPNLDLALTSNGFRLAECAQVLRDAGLDRVTVSLDALDSEAFHAMSGGLGAVDDVLAGIEAARAACFSQVKLNCVVVRGRNEHAILPLVERFRGSGCVLRFIEYMDVGTLNGWTGAAVVSTAEIRAQISAVHALQTLPALNASDVAERWALADGSLELGFIGSVSHPFCGDCTRARVSADGQLYTCLFSSSGHALLPVLRTQGAAALMQRIADVWGARVDRYSEQRLGKTGSLPRAEMYHLGG